MSTTENNVPPVAAPQQQKKRPRLNPARRKSAKSQTDTSQTAAVSAPSVPKPAQAKSLKDDAANILSKTALNSAKQPKPEAVASKQQTALTKQTTPRPSSSRTSSNGSNASKTSSNEPKLGTLALAAPAMVTGGLAGCAAGAAALVAAGLWNKLGGTDSAILAARTAKLCLDNLIEEIIASLQTGTYSAPEALDMLRRTTLAYASTIPGGAPFVERMFREVDMVRRQRGREVDRVVDEACADLSRAGKRGASSEELREIVIKNLGKLSALAEMATQDVVARNPKLRPYRESAVRALQPPPKPRVPTVRLNMTVQHKQPTAKV